MNFRNLHDRLAYYQVPGVSIAVVNNSSLEWAAGFGSAKDYRQHYPQHSPHQSVNTNTIFQAASISKPVTALAAMLMVHRGLLTLDRPVNEKLLSWKIPKCQLTEMDEVTLSGLLSHSAGINVPGFAGYSSINSLTPNLIEILEGRFPANSEKICVTAIPRKHRMYSGGGYQILQQLIVDIGKKPFPKLMYDEILAPLHMDSSTFDLEPNSKWREKVAHGHTQNGSVIPGNWNLYPESAAAGLWSTPSDLAAFMIEVQKSLNGIGKLGLPVNLAQLMTSPQVENGGLGFTIRKAGSSQLFVHRGSNAGYRSLLVGYTNLGLGAIVMTNGENGDELQEEIICSIAKDYHWPEYPTERNTGNG